MLLIVQVKALGLSGGSWDIGMFLVGRVMLYGDVIT